MEDLITKKTLFTLISIFVGIILIGLFTPFVLVKDPPICGQEKDVFGEREQICRDQHHYISLYKKLFN